MGIYECIEHHHVRIVFLKSRFCANVLVQLVKCTLTTHERFIASTLPLSLKDL